MPDYTDPVTGDPVDTPPGTPGPGWGDPSYSPTDLIGSIGRLFGGTSDAGKWGQLAAFMGLSGLANQSSFFNAPPTRVGYQGGIPQFTATRAQTPYMEQRGADYRPGQGGVEYFTPMQYPYSGGNIGIPASNIPGGATPAPAPAATPTTPGGGITEGNLRRTLGADYNRIMGRTDTGAPGALYTGGTPGFDETTGRYKEGASQRRQMPAGLTPDMLMSAQQARRGISGIGGQSRIVPSLDRVTGKVQMPPSAARGIASIPTATQVPGVSQPVRDVAAAPAETGIRTTVSPTAAPAPAAQQTVVESYFAKPMSTTQLEDLASKSTYTIPKGESNIIKSGQIGVKLNDDGEPAEFIYYAPNGTSYTRSAFLPKEFIKYANEFNINPTDLLGIEKGLKENNIGYKPYDIYAGTGSDHGFDIRDFLSGGMGTAYDWTKDPMAAVKGPTGISSLKEAQNIANKFGLKYNQEKYKGGGIDPEQMTQLQGGKEAPRGWAMFSPDNNVASWYGSKEEAEAAAKQYGGNVMDLTGSSVISQDNRNQLTRDDKGNWKLKPPGGAMGGLGSIIRGGYAAGGLPSLATGGRFLRGPGDGVSDSIEARFTRSGEPARLADGEFVIDARTVSELGNGSSEAGARKLYAMMDRVHKMRKKAKRGEPSGADKNLPA